MKGFFSRASKSFLTGGLFAKDTSFWAAEKLCKVGFMVATVSIVVLMPLVFEIAREGQVRFYIYICFFLFRYTSTDKAIKLSHNVNYHFP